MTRSTRQAATGFLADFRNFIMRGNVVDLAVAVVVGGAFSKIIDSLVADIITPVILNPALKATNVEDLQNLSYNGIKYGLFLSSIISFLVIAFSIFIVIRVLEKAQRKIAREEAIAEAEEAATPAPAVVAQEKLTNAVVRLTQAIESQNLSN